MRNFFVIGVLILFLIFAGCTKDSRNTNTTTSNNSGNTTIVCTGAKSFSTDVSPIVQSVCAVSGCHGAGSLNGPGALTSYQQIFNARADIRAAVASGVMPQNSTLSVTQKTNIICWIDNGAPNN